MFCRVIILIIILHNIPKGLAQFVYNSRWNKELNELIEEGLQLLGAEKHLALFQEQCKK
jgi:hypothetical protein